MLYKVKDITGNEHSFTEAQLVQILLYPIDQYHNSALPYCEVMRVCKTPGFPGVTFKFIAIIIVTRYSEIMALCAKYQDFDRHVYSFEGDTSALEFFFNYLSNRRECDKLREEFLANLILATGVSINRAYNTPPIFNYDKTGALCKSISDQIWQRIVEAEISLYGVVLFVNYLYRELVHNELGEEIMPIEDVRTAKTFYEEWGENELEKIFQETMNREEQPVANATPLNQEVAAELCSIIGVKKPPEAKPAAAKSKIGPTKSKAGAKAKSRAEQKPNRTAYSRLREKVETNLIMTVINPAMLSVNSIYGNQTTMDSPWGDSWGDWGSDWDDDDDDDDYSN